MVKKFYASFVDTKQEGSATRVVGVGWRAPAILFVDTLGRVIVCFCWIINHMGVMFPFLWDSSKSFPTMTCFSLKYCFKYSSYIYMNCIIRLVGYTIILLTVWSEETPQFWWHCKDLISPIFKFHLHHIIFTKLLKQPKCTYI